MPKLIIVSGRPASGKTTLAEAIARETGFVLISRDRIKEKASGKPGFSFHPSSEQNAAEIYQIFRDQIFARLEHNESVVAEAAFQHPLWEPIFNKIPNSILTRIIICQVSPDLARERFESRRSTDPFRIQVHQERPLSDDPATTRLIEHYQEINSPFPALSVDCSNGYVPSFPSIIQFIE